MTTCPKCGSRIAEQAHFCPECGTQLAAVRVKRKCAHCGAEIDSQVAVCPECGESLSTNAPLRVPRRLGPTLKRAGWVLAVVVGVLLLVSVARAGLFLPRPAAQPRPTATAPLLALNEPSPSATLAPTDEPTATTEPTQAATNTPTQPPATDTPAAPPATPTPVIHVIQSGESLRSIAEQYNISVDDLARANNMKATDLILVGQKLVIPGQNPAPTAAPEQSQPAATPAPVTYVVQKGDNLLSIALKYNTTVDALMAANGLQNADSLQLGQQLQIPGQSIVQPTLAPTAAPTATPQPTASPTVAATATATPAPATASAATSTPAAGGFEFAAPSLLSPADGSKQLSGEDVLLNWSSVGLLGDDTWYVVRIWRDDPSLPTPPAGWTRTTAWRIPSSYQPAANAASHTFHWSVTVMRVSEGQTPVPVSKTSDTRSFDW